MGDGSAFGLPKEPRTPIRPDGVESRSDEFSDPLERYAPPSTLWDADFDDFLHAYPLLVMDALTEWHETLDGAQGMIVNHATNDVLILLRAVSEGDGRTAARTARALFEHVLHYKEVSSSTDIATQFEEHRHVTAHQLSQADIGLRRLPAKESKKERERLRKLGRQAAKPLQLALAKYGPSFKRGWTAGTSVHALATRHGLLDGYESYRILSGVMHGSAGALFGTRRDKSHHITHRLGMDLQLAPLAFHEGVIWWQALLEQLPSVPDHPDWKVGISRATEMLLDGYSEVFSACRRLDNRMWPTGAAHRKRVAVLALYPSDKVRWFLHDIPAQLLRPAELAEDEPEWLREMIDTMRPQVGTARGRPATAAVEGLRVNPIPGRRPIHAAHLLVPADTFGPADEGIEVAWLRRSENT